jgi:hypothetical protein
MRKLVLLALVTGTLYADEANSKTCNAATIKGSYGYTASASRPASMIPGAPIVEGRILGRRTFDGQGNFTQVDSAKGVNMPALIDQPGSGTYTVNPDCTGTAFLTVPSQPGAAEFRFVIVNNGKEIYFLLVNPEPVMALGHFVRQ